MNDNQISLRESSIFFKENSLTFFNESKGIKIKDIIHLSSTELKEAKERFGRTDCSFGKTAEGKYFCYTHRCGSDLYDSIAKIPLAVVKRVSSTS